MVNEQYYKRRYVIMGIVIAVVLIFIVRLLQKQVFDDSAVIRAHRMSLLEQTIYAPRGLIYDRNGELLVYNQPIYEITMVTNEMKAGRFDTLSFCRAMQMDTTLFLHRMDEMKAMRGYSRYNHQVFMSQLSAVDIAPLQEGLDKYPGVYIRKRTLRDYTYSSAAQVLGSIGEVNQRDIDSDPYYQSGDYSGRDGIERTYEKVLRGEKGVKVWLRDNHGRIRGPYNNGEEDRLPIAGENLTLTLDIQLQLLAEELLQGKVGSVVAIEPKTGEILALVSNPTWNPKMLVGKQRSKNYLMLLNDPTKPLMNRATMAQYPPGSTFKTLQSLVCLQEGGISPGKMYPCNGPSSSPIKCTHHHGSPVNLLNAIEQSCNPYYWQAYRDMLEKNGYGKNDEKFRARYQLWCEDVMSFGLGHKFEDTDVPQVEQARGKIPTLEHYDRLYGKGGWKALTIRSNSIGQGEVLVTPLQLCNMVSAIANGGYYITPHLCKNDTMLTHRHETAVDEKWFPLVRQGMGRVMTNGTGRHYALENLPMGGKTGTVQNRGRDHALFIGFAPLDDPQIAVAVVVENAGFGATWAAPIASLVMERYITGEVKRTDLRERIASAVLNTNVKKRK